MKKPKVEPKPETKCFCNKGEQPLEQNYPRYLVDEKAGKVERSMYWTYIILNVYFTSTPSSSRVLDTGSVTIIGDLKQKLRTKQRLAKGEVTMCVGSVSKVDEITIACSICLRD